ncbi:MAG: T9SS C-terminal target domain-containing protein [Chitinophagia bacterium]|nr:T9SS C-terminal target domain-containing protein [Chitinophagia bacterium]
MLNNYFSADLNTYQKGRVTYSLPKLAEGPHEFVIKAWDLIGNSSKDTIRVLVPNETNLTIRNLTNYPNPVEGYTRFSFEINQTKNVEKNLEFCIEIFNQQGVKILAKNYDHITVYNRTVIADFVEIGTLPPGVYFYKLTIKNSNPLLSATNKLIKY